MGHPSAHRASPGPEAAYRWRIAPEPPDRLATALPGTHPLLLRALAARGIGDAAEARAFIRRDGGDDDPFRLAGIEVAVDRLRRAVRGGETIAVYGDYDADGVTATALLVETLRALGAACVRPYIPHRERDGYGVHAAALEALAREGAGVVVTVDCGIRAGAEVAAAVKAGLDVIVTDHHTLPETLPEATAVINPRRTDCGYGFTELAGVGLAFKLAQALLRDAGGSRAIATVLDEAALLDLVALGTVADMVPLVGENRALVHRGLDRLRASDRPGIRALARAAGCELAALTTRDLGFALGPRLNAAGRIDDAGVALDLLLAPDGATAEGFARELEAHNTARRDATRRATDSALERLAIGSSRPFVLDASPDIALGVVGLVASRLVDLFYRPAAVVRVEGELARGSARSIPEFDIVAALDQSADLLVRHGGHARAAGFTVRTDDLPALEARLAALAEASIGPDGARPALDVTAEIRPTDIGWDLWTALQALEPYGEGNPQPRFLWRRATVGARRAVGGDGQHLKLALEGGPGVGTLDAIAFRRGADAPSVGRHVDVVFTLSENVWRGARRLELKVDDIGRAGTAVDT